MTLALGIAATIIALGGLIFTAVEWRSRCRADAAERKDRIDQIENAAAGRDVELEALARAVDQSAVSTRLRVLRHPPVARQLGWRIKGERFASHDGPRLGSKEPGGEPNAAALPTTRPALRLCHERAVA
jgi:hypothetical protein